MAVKGIRLQTTVTGYHHATAGHGSDDLMLFELYIQFDWDKAIIKPEFFPKLDIIAKVLQRDAGATATDAAMRHRGG